MKDDRRLIEDFIPIKEISAESAREKSIRKGHISTLHLWWARRPLVASRAAVFASLVAAPENDQKRSAYKKQMIDLCKWEAGEETIAKAKRSILEAQRTRLGLPENTPLNEVPSPKVLDMFAGGGAIPLEALRLGCETYAVDLNPVAHIIELCTLVYPQKYGQKLADEVEKWGNWVIEKVRSEIGDLYPRIGELGVGNLELGGGDLELGSGEEGKDQNLSPNNDGKLQGFNSLAEGDRLGYSGVSGNEEFSGGGEICSDLSDPTSGNIDSSEYRGGVGTRFNQRIHLSSTGSQGIVDGTGNSSDCGATSELSGSGQFEGIASEDRDDRQNVERFNQEVTEQALGELGMGNLELGMGNLEFGTPNS